MDHLLSFVLVLALVVFFEKTNAGSIKNVEEKAEKAKIVYVNNYDRAETDIHMNVAINGGWLGKMYHFRNVTPILSSDQRQVVRMNRDTLYSSTVFDLTSPVTFEMPPTNGIYMSLYALDEDQYSVAMFYPDILQTTTVTFTYDERKQQQQQQQQSGDSRGGTRRVENGDIIVSSTRYIYIIIRTLANPYDKVDLARANALQDAVKITQASIGELKTPTWDTPSLFRVRAMLNSMAEFLEPGVSLNGYRGRIDPAVHLIGTAALWGGLPVEDAAYQIYYPPRTATSLSVFFIRVTNVPIKPTGFWSISVYNSKGLLELNPYDSYSHNSLTAKPEADGSFIIYFSAVKTENMTNWIFTYPGWNYMARMYEPLDVIINNEWQFPPLQTAPDLKNSAQKAISMSVGLCLSLLSISFHFLRI